MTYDLPQALRDAQAHVAAARSLLDDHDLVDPDLRREIDRSADLLHVLVVASADAEADAPANTTTTVCLVVPDPDGDHAEAVLDLPAVPRRGDELEVPHPRGGATYMRVEGVAWTLQPPRVPRVLLAPGGIVDPRAWGQAVDHLRQAGR